MRPAHAGERGTNVVQQHLQRNRWWKKPVLLFAALLFITGLLFSTIALIALLRYTGDTTQRYLSIEEHFKYGSIGSEPESGLPYWVWKALPQLMPEHFARGDYEQFGFLYETDDQGVKRDLPIGISQREVRGVDLVWLNCAVCHTGTYRAHADADRHVVLGMPSNNLDFHAFVKFIVGLAVDERMNAEHLLPAMQSVGADLDWLDKLVWQFYVIPRLREGLLTRWTRVSTLLEEQPPWGPGRVDTFNPYKLIQFAIPYAQLSPEERVGTADFPAIFLQAPREGMNLHWDGNNISLQERNLSAAIGAGITESSVDHEAIERVANWLRDLPPPVSPYVASEDKVSDSTVRKGQAIYASACAQCHGYQAQEGYVFEGALLGQITPITAIETDPARLDSYTQALRDLQLTLFQTDSKYRFRHFKKTDGYANLPLDGLWLRAPYLHNGSVPTLRDLLLKPADRPKAFIRGSDVLDSVNLGFSAPECTHSIDADAFCMDTSLPGNAASGHAYGTNLPDSDKAALLAYLRQF